MFVAPFPCWKGAWPRWPQGVAFWAHIGGFVAGAVLTRWFLRAVRQNLDGSGAEAQGRGAGLIEWRYGDPGW